MLSKPHRLRTRTRNPHITRLSPSTINSRRTQVHSRFIILRLTAKPKHLEYMLLNVVTLTIAMGSKDARTEKDVKSMGKVVKNTVDKTSKIQRMVDRTARNTVDKYSKNQRMVCRAARNTGDSPNKILRTVDRAARNTGHRPSKVLPMFNQAARNTVVIGARKISNRTLTGDSNNMRHPVMERKVIKLPRQVMPPILKVTRRRTLALKNPAMTAVTSRAVAINKASLVPRKAEGDIMAKAAMADPINSSMEAAET